MSDERRGPVEQFLEAERQFHELMPVKDSYSKLFFRTILWFVLFSTVYLVLTGL
ncbi:hypothetical protein ACFQPA_16830 [Halomarina halobia]|uniref:DUF485 domain-containing protein n=1 Tax=Halomarina halobia TaxID=3033386 RepID=A0ABD6ADQ7_9EURY|nr:hypothetical protein [Halomarina sp. PSR21]